MTALQNRHLVFLGYVWPEPSSSAAGVRTVSLVQHALSAGAKVSFLSPSKRNRFSESLENMGVTTHETAANDSAFDSLISSLKPDTVIFDRFVLEEQFGWRVHQSCPNALRIVDSQDIHFLRKERERALNGGDLLFQSDEVLRELASIYRSHKTLVVSDFEMSLLKDRFKVPPNRIEYLPLCFKAGEEFLPSFQERKGFVFLGNFRHPPNLDGVLWFAKNVFPLLKGKIPSAEAHFYGAYPPKEISSLHAPERGLFVHGPASEDLHELANYRVNLAPLRFGAGIKGKIADGWRFGLPCVSTESGAEGMRLVDRSFGGIVSDEAGFVDACLALHEKEAMWTEKTSLGARTLNEKFSVDENRRAFVELLQSLLENKSEIEQDNLFGRILWRNQHRSTEYFSRWIEEKNKRAPTP